MHEKKAEIARIKKSADELKEANEKLIGRQSNLEKELEEQKSIVDSLKNQLKACCELNGQLKRETELQAIRLIDFEADIATKMKSNDDLKAQIDIITAKTSKQLDENSHLNEKYKCDLAASSDLNTQLKAENEALKGKLAVAENSIKFQLFELKTKSDAIVCQLSGEIKELVKLNSESVGRCKELQLEIDHLKCRPTQTFDDKVCI